MKPKASVFIATSLDGFIARVDGGLDWLDAANATVPTGEDCGYSAFMQSIDTLVMGRNTYEKVLSFGPWPYGSTPVIVLSSKPIHFPDTIPDTVTHSAENPLALCERLSSQGVDHIYVDGGNTIGRFLSANLIDELTITIIPVLLGTGIPLFSPIKSDIALTCVDSKTFDFGFVQLKYAISQ
jgi:dihydrofolate reductase